LSEILPSIGLVPGPDEVGQKGQNYSTYDVTYKISKTQNKKKIYCRHEDLQSLLRV